MSSGFSSRTSAPATPDAALSRSLLLRSRTRFTDVLHIFVLTSFAFAQPIYDRLGAQPVFLVDQNITSMTAALFASLLTIGLPTAIVIFQIAVSRLGRRAYDAMHTIFVFVLFVLLALPVCSRVTFLNGPVMVCTALVMGCVGIWCYFEFERARTLVTFCAPGIVIFPAAFLIQFATATATIGPSASRSAHWKPVPVVLLVFDEFCGSTLMTPEREIDAQRFPNFAALSRQSTWFRNAASVNPVTTLALPAILSGKYPTETLVPGPAQLPQNLFNVMTSTGGYELVAFEPVSSLAPRSLEATGHRLSKTWEQTLSLADILGRVYLFHVVPSDYHIRLPLIPRIWFGMHSSVEIDRTQHRGIFDYNWNGRRHDQFQHFLDCIDSTPDSVLYFGHFLLPHFPWRYLPSGHRYSEDNEDWESLCLDSDRKIADDDDDDDDDQCDDVALVQNEQHYLLQLMYVDRLIGKLMSRLSEAGVLDRSLLIVTADHGVSFRAKQPRRWLTPGNQDNILSIPLFVKLPQQSVGQISDRHVQSVDILPTIADVVGMTLSVPTDGWSVFDTSRPERTQLTVTDAGITTTVDPATIQTSNTPAELRQRFGSSSDPDSLFRIGPIPELIGRTVESLPQSTETPMTIQLVSGGDTIPDVPDAVIPCDYKGVILSPKPTHGPLILAIAINGTIRVVTQTDQHENTQHRWAALVPESAFHVGQNDVQFFAVTGPDLRLTPIPRNSRVRNFKSD